MSSFHERRAANMAEMQAALAPAEQLSASMTVAAAGGSSTTNVRARAPALAPEPTLASARTSRSTAFRGSFVPANPLPPSPPRSRSSRSVAGPSATTATSSAPAGSGHEAYKYSLRPAKAVTEVELSKIRRYYNHPSHRLTKSWPASPGGGYSGETKSVRLTAQEIRRLGCLRGKEVGVGGKDRAEMARIGEEFEELMRGKISVEEREELERGVEDLEWVRRWGENGDEDNGEEEEGDDEGEDEEETDGEGEDEDDDDEMEE